MSRKEDWKRISNLAGLDEDGGILPPSSEGGINREPNHWWRTVSYCKPWQELSITIPGSVQVFPPAQGLKPLPDERIILVRRSMENEFMTDSLTDQTIANIMQTWKGGERRLAGRRASELAFGNGKTANQAVVDKLLEECPGIGEFISAPEVPVNWVSADRPENKQDDDFSNKSPDSSKADQDAIDAKLEAGRKRSEQAPDDQNLTGSTKLNPSETAAKPSGKPGKK